MRFIDWDGVRVLETSLLEEAILTSSASWIPWRTWRPFDPDVLEEDTLRIERAYRQHGYYEARARAKAVDHWYGLRVRFGVEEGPPVRLAIRSIALPAELPTEIDRAALLDGLLLREGEVFGVATYRASRTLLLDRLARVGYPNARVAGGAQVDLEARTAIVHWTIAPGPRVSFGDVDIRGLEDVEEAIVRDELRELGFLARRGEGPPAEREIYSPAKLRRAQRTLYDLGLFRSVTVEANAPEVEEETPSRPDDDPASARADADASASASGERNEAPAEEIAPVWPVEVRVRERPPRRLEVAVGYGTEDGFRARGEWRHRNFFGGLRRVRVAGKYSFLVTGVDFEFIQPHFFRRDLTLGLDASLSQNDEPAFDTEGISLGWRLERPLFEKVVGRMGQRLELREVTNVEANEAVASARDNESFRLSLLEFGLRRFSVDSKVDPRRGTRFSLFLEPSLRVLGSEVDYLRTELDLRGYLPLYFDELVLAGRVRFGVLETFGGDDFDEVPIFKRFFSGGDSSVRGFGLDLLGPVDANEDPIGGLTVGEASLELRFPVWRFLGGVFFTDAGHVNTESFEFDADDVFYSIGAGVRMSTPIGPLRLDVATPLNAPRGYPDVRIHFSVGHSF